MIGIDSMARASKATIIENGLNMAKTQPKVFYVTIPERQNIC
jgi:hypothetical protein